MVHKVKNSNNWKQPVVLFLRYQKWLSEFESVKRNLCMLHCKRCNYNNGAAMPVQLAEKYNDDSNIARTTGSYLNYVIMFEDFSTTIAILTLYSCWNIIKFSLGAVKNCLWSDKAINLVDNRILHSECSSHSSWLGIFFVLQHRCCFHWLINNEHLDLVLWVFYELT